MRLWNAVTATIAAVLSATILSSLLAQQPAPAPQGIAWQADIATAQQLAGQSGKLVLVHFWAPWCKPCMKLEQEVFSRPETAQALNASFICVKVNTDQAGEIAKSYNVTSLPTDVVLTKEGRLIAQLQCPQAANQYIQQISQVAAGYKQLSNQLVAEAGRASEYASQLRGQFASGAAALGAAAPSAPVTSAVAQAPAAAPAAAPPAAPSAAPPAGSSSTQGEAVSAYSTDRYADYFRNRQQATADTVKGAVAGAGAATAAVATAAADYGSRYAPVPSAAVATAPPAVAAAAPPPTATAPAFPPQVPAVAEQRSPVVAPQAAAIQLPPGSPPLVLDGYCTVQLKEQKRWVAGDRRWGAVHRGRTYLFTGPEEQKKFLENPDMYAPVISGNDPVLALDNGQAIPGRREHGVFYENRIYLFADEASLGRFYQNPNRYAAEVIQAMR